MWRKYTWLWNSSKAKLVILSGGIQPIHKQYYFNVQWLTFGTTSNKPDLLSVREPVF